MQHTQQQTDPFVRLIREQERLIYKVCSIYAPDAEQRRDLFQEIVLQAWTAYPRFQQASKVSTWLYKVALNTAISHQRKQRKYSTVDDSMLEQFADTMPDVYKEEYKILQQLIGSLPKLEKALILLYLEDKSYEEIAEIMGLTITNVGTKLGRIKEKLRKQAQPFINA